MAEGEKQKVIQLPPHQPQPNPKLTNHPKHEPQPSDLPQPSSPDPSIADINNDPISEAIANDDLTPELGQGHCVRKPKGAYKQLHEGLTAAISETNHTEPDETNLTEWLVNAQPEFVLITSAGPAPCTLEEAYNVPNKDKSEKAWQYEIAQLKKLGTWVIEDLPKGQVVIPCSEVLREKLGPNGETNVF